MDNIKKIFYRDLVQINTIENGEAFVSTKDSGILSGYIDGMRDMDRFFGGEMLVRESVLEKLRYANEKLQKIDENLSIYVVYGYRSLDIQTNRFLKRLQETSGKFIEDPVELYEKIHCSVAVPTVAGHPTGGAVDVLLFDTENNKFLDFGTQIYDYKVSGHEISNKNIPKKVQKNRKLLRKCMIIAGFAAYYGEYWHFSYGDKEWAFYYKQPNAIYEQVPIDRVVFNPTSATPSQF